MKAAGLSGLTFHGLRYMTAARLAEAGCSTGENHRVMITIIRGALVRLFFYWKKPVTDRLGRCCQNDNFIVVTATQD